MIQKNKPYRSAKYKKWVKTLPCCLCESDGVDPHHLTGVGNMGGMGTTAPDTMLMPLCRLCHDMMHQNPTLWPDQWQHIAQTLNKAISQGVIK